VVERVAGMHVTALDHIVLRVSDVVCSTPS
jgi:hypothetical protein